MQSVRPVTIATRASRLALWQSEHVATLLRAARPGLAITLLPMTTTGDRIIDQPLAKIGGKGLFIKELEVAMLEGRAEIAVHSMKDMPAALPEEFVIGAILPREDARDVLVSRDGRPLSALAGGERVGTSSLRRRSQLKARYPMLTIDDLRGNVPTRLERLASGHFDAIVLAAAGLKRLELMDGRAALLSIDDMLPAVGQGAIGIECRADDAPTRELLAGLNCHATATVVTAERAMNATLGGSCQVPIAGHARLDGDELRLDGLVAAIDGTEVIRQTATGHRSEAARIGREVGEALLTAGADRILAMLNEN